ncbi:MAG: hypothetical protein CSA22_00575 [Deltaproteobacteria bacterium]|nr:MAG: hypothetical protein CSA22_00575 [Deltaproteobacteria bacterium]
MTRFCRLISCWLLACLVSGCAASVPGTRLAPDTRAYLDRLADTHTANGDYPSACFIRETLVQLEPGNPETVTQLAVLRSEQEALAARYVDKGRQAEANSRGKAIAWYLKALAVQPDHVAAKQRLLALTHHRSDYFHRSPGLDTDPQKLAAALYGTDAAVELVRFLMTANAAHPLPAGGTLIFPRQVPDSGTDTRTDAAERLEKARIASEEGDFPGAISQLESLMADLPGNASAENGYRQVRYAWAVSLLDQKDMSGALKQLAPIIDSYPPARSLADQIRVQQVSRQWMNVKKKVDALASGGNYQAALTLISKFRETAHDFGAARARENDLRVQFSGALLRSGQLLEARRVVQEILPPTAGSGKLLSEIQDAIVKTAESHYRRGVDLFVREQLETAISEWLAVLELVPDHKNAIRDLSRARNLLEKLRQID